MVVYCIGLGASEGKTHKDNSTTLPELFLLTRDACLVYNSFNFAFFHRLLDGLRSLYHGLRDLL